MNVFKSEASREQLAAWYPRFRAKIPGELEERDIETRFGRTHVLFAGPKDAPPLLLVHGAMASSAHVLSELAPLARSRRIIAPDVLGQSAMSADVRLPLDSDSCGAWLGDVLDGVALSKADLLGVSWGGFIALRAAAAAPTRFSRLVLLVPAGIINTPPLPALWKVALPMLGWRMFGASALFTTLDEDWMRWIGEAFIHFKFDFSAPPLAQSKDIAPWKGPIFAVGASDDLSFPGDLLLSRIRELFPHAETELLEGSKHAPPFEDSFRERLSERIERFLDSDSHAPRS